MRSQQTNTLTTSRSPFSPARHARTHNGPKPSERVRNGNTESNHRSIPRALVVEMKAEPANPVFGLLCLFYCMRISIKKKKIIIVEMSPTQIRDKASRRGKTIVKTRRLIHPNHISIYRGRSPANGSETKSSKSHHPPHRRSLSIKNTHKQYPQRGETPTFPAEKRNDKCST